MKKRMQCWAWLMILLLLLESLPVAALADPSETYGGTSSVGNPTAAEVIQAAIDSNENNLYVAITDVTVSPDSGGVATGAWYQYGIFYELKPAPYYYANEGDVDSLPCYTQYDQVVFTFTAPANIELAASGLTKNQDGTYTYTLTNLDVRSRGIASDFELSARMTDNGSAADNTAYGQLQVTATADVTAAVSLTSLTFADVPVLSNDTAIVNEATAVWDVRKSPGDADPVVDETAGEVTFAYQLEVGKIDDAGTLLKTRDHYDVTGSLAFSAFSLSDTPAAFLGASGNNVEPIRWSAIPYDSDGAPDVAQTVSGSSETLSIGYYNEISATGNAGGATVSGSQTVPIPLPMYTKYAVSVTYPMAELMAPYGQADVTYELANACTLNYTAVGGESQTQTASAGYTYSIQTPPGFITVQQYLRMNDPDEPNEEYDAFYHAFFPGAAYSIYREDNFDTVTGTPKGAAEETLTITDFSKTSANLKPGLYYVAMAAAPKDRNTQTDLPMVDAQGNAQPQTWQAVTVTSDTNPAVVSFYHKVAGQGLLKLKKTKVDGSALPGVTFTLTPTAAGDTATYSATTDAYGVAYILAPEGEYTLGETVPDDYIRATEQTVTIQAARTTDISDTPIVNVDNFATLHLSVNAVLHQRGDRVYATGDAVPVHTVAGIDTTGITFTLSRSTSADFPAASTTTQTVALAAGQSEIALTGLWRTSDGTEFYWYRLTQNANADPALVADPYLDYVWQYSDTADKDCVFYDQLLSKLIFRKVAQTLSPNDYAILEAADSGRGFTLYRRMAEGTFEAVDNTLVTDTDGKATTAYLPIADAQGEIAYFLAEDPIAGFTALYPSAQTITVGGQPFAAWGPIALAHAKVTDLSASASRIINRQNQGQIRIYKRQTGYTDSLEGAVFEVTYHTPEDPLTPIVVQNGSENTFTTTMNGVLINNLPIGYTYSITETTSPAGYRNDATPDPIEVTISDPLAQQTIYAYNNRKPTLAIQKRMQDPTTGNEINFSGTFTFALFRWDDTAMIPVTNESAQMTASVTVGNTVSGTTAPMVVEDAGSNYYVAETAYPDTVIPPQLWLSNSSIGKAVDGVFYYWVPTLSDNQSVTLTVQNRLNKGKLTISKKNSKTNAALAGATYTVSVSSPGSKAIALLTASGVGFAQVSTNPTVYQKTVTFGTSTSKTITDLPVYNDDGQALKYSVVETVAPTGFRLPEDNTAREIILATPDKYTATTEYRNAPIATLKALKMYYRVWENKSNRLLYPLPGTTLALYQLDAANKLAYVNTAEPTVATTDANGQALFENLDGTKTYLVLEMAPPTGFELPEDKQGYSDYAALIGMDATAAAATYNAGRYNLMDAANNAYVVTKDNALQNAKPYAQFRLTKVDYLDRAKLLDMAKFALYGCTEETLAYYQDQGLSGAALFNAIPDSKWVLKPDYTYETGTALTTGGAASTGTFQTKPLEYGLVYWFLETRAPDGYSILADSNPVGPFRSNGGYLKNTFTDITVANASASGGGTGTPIRYFQIQINKKLVNESGVFQRNLAGVTFALYLADADYQFEPENLLTHFTTGLDTYVADYASVAGRGISETLEFSSLYANPQYTGLITREPAAEGSPFGYQYRANFVLVETAYPGNATPQRVRYPLTLDTAAYTTQKIVDHTYDRDATGDRSIVNVMAQKAPVRIRKLGYTVPLTQGSALTPLAGVTIGVYANAACTTLLASDVTDDLGYADFTLEPNTDLWYREITASGTYDINVEVFAFHTGNYGSDLQTLILKDPAYRVLKIAKKNADGTQVGGVTLRVITEAGGTIKDTNGVAYTGGADVVTTLAADFVAIPLPYSINGAYSLAELSVPGRTLSAADKLNFTLANQAAGILPIQFAAEKAEKEVTLVNPDLATFQLTKRDDAGQPMAGVSFSAAFKSFAYADLATAVTATADTGWGSPVLWSTDSNGEIRQDALTPGWYKLTETLPDGYVDTGVASRTHIVKMTAKAIGQTDADPVTLAVSNIRKGYLALQKTFEGNLLESVPQQVVFSVFTDEQCLTPATPASITVPISNGAGSRTTALDPGTYYLTEAAGAWFGRYTVDSATEKWVNGAIRVTITSERTMANPVVIAVVNRPSLATVTLQKLDDNGLSIPGARFAIYYTASGERYYYHHALRAWTTDTDSRTLWTTDVSGLATVSVTLPLERLMTDEGASAYFLQEIEAPPALEFAEDRPVTLTQMANVLDITADPLVDRTGLYIDLTKYARTRAHATASDTLAGASFTLYMLEGDAATELVTATSAADGTLRFPNLKKLSGNRTYAVAETVTPTGYVEGLTEVTLNGDTVTPVTITVRGVSRQLFPLTQDQTVSAKAYNTPAGKLAVLKYNYLEPASAAEHDVPHYARFRVEQLDANGDVLATVQDNLLVTYYEAGDPATLPGNIQKNAATGLYRGTNGTYYTDRVIGNLAPGRYRVVETQQADRFYYTPNSQPGDAWYHTRDVEVDDDGGVAVCMFANIPKPDAPKIAIDKTVVAINGSAGQTTVPSLQGGWQKITYQVAGFARATDGQPIQLPLDWLELMDHELTFTDGTGATVTDVSYYTLSVTVGKVAYEATPLNPSPVKEVIYANVYGVKADGAEVLVSTRNVSETAQKVSFPENTYVGFHIRYGMNNDGSAETGLKAGFTAEPVLAEMLFRQEDDPSVVPVRSLRNRTAVQLKYNLGGIDSIASGWTADVAAIATTPEPTKPRVTLTLTCDKLSVMPQDVVTYTIVLRNTSADGAVLTDPVLVDLMPNLLEYTPDSMVWSTLPAGITADAPVVNGDYLYAKFHGELAPGAAITVTVQATVRTVAESANSFTNQIFATSTYRIHRNVDNPTGTAFTDSKGDLPDAANFLDGTVFGAASEHYLTLKAQLESNMNFNRQVTLYKMAAADMSGMEEYKGSESYAIASTSDDGTANIRYKLVLRNDGDRTIENIRILDKLPTLGDLNIGANTTRDSRWPVTFAGVTDSSAQPYTVYTTANAETPNSPSSNYIRTLKEGDLDGWSTAAGDYAGAKAVLIAFDPSVTILPGQSLTVYIACKAPTTAEATAGSEANSQNYYFSLSRNTATAGFNQINSIIRSTVDSARASVLLNPALVTLGNRVWVDRNANGLQDVGEASEDIDQPGTVFTQEPSLTGASGLTVTLRTYVNSDASYTTRTATLGENGFYRLEQLFPGRIQANAMAAAYDSAGNLINSKLFGMRRTSYQLVVSGIPQGYLVSRAYANTGGSYAPNYENNTLAQRRNDSNFQVRNGISVSETFYLPVGADNPTLDLGLIRYRNVTLIKHGTDGNLLDGATFRFFGPFTDAEMATALNLDGRTPIATVTTQSGIASFVSTSSTSHLNHYQNYVVVETTPAATWYPADDLSASGGHVAAGAGYPAITGGGISHNNFFVLTSRDDTDTGSVTETVQVTDAYTPEGILQITGSKQLVGGTLQSGVYGFTLTSSDHPGFTTQTVTHDAAGNFAFPAIQYGYSDSGKTYHYVVAERNDGAAGIAYDAGVYSLAVRIINLGDGLLDVQKTLTDASGQPASAIVFQNVSRGTLQLTKAIAGNAPDAADSFAFTIALRDAQDRVLTGTYACTHSGDSSLTSITPDAQGNVTVSLKGSERFTVTGLLTGTRYTVTEADYRQTGYTTVATDATGVIATDAQVNEVLFTNTRNTGNLTVSKTLEGTAPSSTKVFALEIALSNAQLPVNGTYACTTTGGKTQTAVTFAQGKATVELTGGQSITVLGIYADTAYTVTETDYAADAYTPTPASRIASGVITVPTVPQPAAVAAFANRRDASTLTVQKALAGNATDATKSFTLEITLLGSGAVNVNRTYPCAAGSAVAQLTFSGGKATVALRGGQHVTLTDIPVGTQYSVREASYTADGYAADYLPDADPHTLLQAGAGITIVNTRNTYGALVVSKTVAGAAASTDKTFAYTLRLSRTDTLAIDQGYVCVRTNSVTGATAAESLSVTGGEGKFSLKANESLAIAGILTGTAYTVTEDDYRGDGYFPTPASGVQQGVIYDADRTYTAPFVNTRGAGKLIISNTLEGNAIHPEKPFTYLIQFTRTDGIDMDGVFECILTGPNTETPVQLRFVNGMAETTLTHGQSLTIQAILKDTHFLVTQGDYETDGYHTVPAALALSGDLTADEQVCRADFLNIRNTGNLMVAKDLAGNGASATQAFNFTVTLARTDRVPINVPYTCDVTNGASTVKQTVTFAGGKARLSLIGGQRAILYGIPTGTDFTVSEDNYVAEGYTATASGTSGVINTARLDAVFVNTRNVGTLTVSKTLQGNAVEPSRTFRFTVRVLDRDGRGINGTYPASGVQTSLTFSGGVATVALKGGESVTVQGLLSSWTYTVSETEANTGGYVTTATGTSGVIGRAGSTAAYVNTRNMNQAYTKLTVTKTWNDQNNRDGIRPASITVYLLNGNTVLDTRVLTEASGWTTVFSSLPVFAGDGTAIPYRVTEGVIAKYYAQVTYGLETAAILNTHNPEAFKAIRSAGLLVLTTYDVPLGGNINMNEGDCFN